MSIIKCCSYLFFILMLSACGFHLQGETKLVPPLERLYLQTADPYGVLSRQLQQNLKMSHVYLTTDRVSAKTVLVILQDHTSEELISVSSTQQTRQYNLRVTISFEINDAQGRTIVPTQTLTETRTITVQSDQILGNSNEANLYYQQMRRSLAYAIMNRIASSEISSMVVAYFSNPKLSKL